MLCCICLREMITTNPRRYFCRKYWGEWHDAILAKAPWVNYCVNHERRQRRQALKNQDLIYPGNEFEIGGFDGEYRLVPTAQHYQEWD